MVDVPQHREHVWEVDVVTQGHNPCKLVIIGVGLLLLLVLRRLVELPCLLLKLLLCHFAVDDEQHTLHQVRQHGRPHLVVPTLQHHQLVQSLDGGTVFFDLHSHSEEVVPDPPVVRHPLLGLLEAVEGWNLLVHLQVAGSQVAPREAVLKVQLHVSGVAVGCPLPLLGLHSCPSHREPVRPEHGVELQSFVEALHCLLELLNIKVQLPKTTHRGSKLVIRQLPGLEVVVHVACGITKVRPQEGVLWVRLEQAFNEVLCLVVHPQPLATLDDVGPVLQLLVHLKTRLQHPDLLVELPQLVLQVKDRGPQDVPEVLAPVPLLVLHHVSSSILVPRGE
eukprot:Sspe_Gene.41786::Locus_20227_Transcript_1_1_Confidence_1.000_Length_1544::g.41786::m.41786